MSQQLIQEVREVREALARVEAAYANRLRNVKQLESERDTAQTQLAEAVGLLRELRACNSRDSWPVLIETDAFLARHVQAEQQEVCWQCGGTGEADTGGVMPWGAPAMTTCPCQRESKAEQQESQGPMAKVADGLRQKAADEWANHPSNPANQEAQGAQAGDEAVRKDAGRYRWLRANDAHPSDWNDEAIDAAMRAQGDGFGGVRADIFALDEYAAGE